MYGTAFDLKRDIMENGLIELLMPKSSLLAKEPVAILPENSDKTSLEFAEMFNTSMSEGLEPFMQCMGLSDAAREIVIDEVKTADNDSDATISSEATREIPCFCLDTQSLLSLFQKLFAVQNFRDTATPTDGEIDVEDSTAGNIRVNEVLQNILSLLEAGDSVRITLKNIPAPAKEQKRSETLLTHADHMTDTDHITRADHTAKADANQPGNALKESDETDDGIEITGYLTQDINQPQVESEARDLAGRITAALEQMQHTTGSASQSLETAPEASPVRYEVSFEGYTREPKLSHDNETRKLQVPPDGLPAGTGPEKREIIKTDDGRQVRPERAIIEIVKPMPGNNAPASLSGELPVGDNVPAAKPVDVSIKVNEAINNALEERNTTVEASEPAKSSDEKQMFSGGGFSRVNPHPESERRNVIDKNAFASVMTEKIEKLSEQFAGKSMSLDMVVRLRIDDKETLIVGFKEHGQRVSVEIRTTNENTGSFLQTQKDELTRQLEARDIHASIYVDIQNQNKERREQQGKSKKNTAEHQEKSFDTFIETMA